MPLVNIPDIPLTFFQTDIEGAQAFKTALQELSLMLMVGWHRGADGSMMTVQEAYMRH